MYKIKHDDGTVAEYHDLDINVWCAEEGEPVRLTIYPVTKAENGDLFTVTNRVVATADTSFSPTEYYDEWYGWDALAPGEAPGEVVDLVRSILKEVQV